MYAILNNEEKVVGTVRSITGVPSTNVKVLNFNPPVIDATSQLMKCNPMSDWLVYSDRVEATYKVVNRNLETEKAETTKNLKYQRNTAMNGGVEVTIAAGTHWFDSDSAAKDNVSQAAQDADKRPEQWPKGWRTKHNNWVPLTLEDIEAVRAAIADHVEACFTRHGQLEAEIAAVTTFTELDAIQIDTWPTGALA